jgi:TonB family protein
LWAEDQTADTVFTPHILIQLEDDLERSRLREAFWISVVVHLLIIILVVMAPKMFPGMRGVIIASPADLMRNQQLTYLDLPPDMQKEPKVRPETEVLSDKNRIAESRHPTLDKRTLEELRRADAPGMQAPPAQSAQMTPPASQPPLNPSQGQQTAQLRAPQMEPKLPTPSPGVAKFPNLGGAMSPGSAIEQAARAVAERRGTGTFGGGGDYGMGPGKTAARVQGNLEVLSDTQGVDFGPYLSRVLQVVRMNWYNLIPEEARAPLMKRGKVSIEFAIMPDGKVAGMRIIGPSGDIALDRAAWGGISASIPFSPLPSEFHGPYLALRFHFYYNPAKGELD